MAELAQWNAALTVFLHNYAWAWHGTANTRDRIILANVVLRRRDVKEAYLSLD